jgi:hypothetical protein
MNKTKMLTVLLALGMGVGFMAHPVRGGQSALASNRPAELVSWDLELADGVRARLKASVGEIVRLTAQDGSELAFQPFAAEEGTINIRVFRVSTSKALGREHFEPLETAELRLGSDWSSSQWAGLKMRIAPAAERAGDAEMSKVVGVPLSDLLIHWELTFASGRQAKMIAREGEVVRLKLVYGRSFGFVPVVRDAERGDISFRMFSIQKVKGVGEKLRFLETFDVQPGGEYFPEALGGSLVKVSSVRRVTPEDLEFYLKLGESEEVIDGCCVTCDGTKVCGCAVGMDCGDCCSGICCSREF